MFSASKNMLTQSVKDNADLTTNLHLVTGKIQMCRSADVQIHWRTKCLNITLTQLRAYRPAVT